MFFDFSFIKKVFPNASTKQLMDMQVDFMKISEYKTKGKPLTPRLKAIKTRIDKVVKRKCE